MRPVLEYIWVALFFTDYSFSHFWKCYFFFPVGSNRRMKVELGSVLHYVVLFSTLDEARSDEKIF